MSQLHYLSAFTEIGVTDLDASVRWYEEELGFQRIATYGGAIRDPDGNSLRLFARHRPGPRL